MDGDGDLATYGRTYTRGRRQPYLIRKWPGSQWTLPLGPYTVTQLGVFVGSVYLLISYRDVWAHFGPFNLFIGVGVPIALTLATKHTRIEGRDPLRAGAALAGLFFQPRRGYLGGDPWRTPKPVQLAGAPFPIAALPAPLVARQCSPQPVRQPVRQQLQQPAVPPARRSAEPQLQQPTQQPAQQPAQPRLRLAPTLLPTLLPAPPRSTAPGSAPGSTAGPTAGPTSALEDGPEDGQPTRSVAELLAELRREGGR